MSRYKFCIVTERHEWLSVVSQYTIVYYDQQGLAWLGSVLQYTGVYCDRQGLEDEAIGHNTKSVS